MGLWDKGTQRPNKPSWTVLKTLLSTISITKRGQLEDKCSPYSSNNASSKKRDKGEALISWEVEQEDAEILFSALQFLSTGIIL